MFVDRKGSAAARCRTIRSIAARFFIIFLKAIFSFSVAFGGQTFRNETRKMAWVSASESQPQRMASKA
eukprot:SAG22_NODE_656_length_8099_cov_2.665500_3_plen_68_part_00